MEDCKTSATNLAVKPDRTLVITLRPTLVWTSWTQPYNIDANFTASLNPVGTTPDMDSSRVAANGDIDFYPLPDRQNYNDNCDVTINLDTSGMFDHTGTQAVQARFAYATEYSGTGPVTGFGWFCAMQNVPRRQYNTTPITVQNMDFTRIGDTQLLINDDTPGNGNTSYAYCVGIVLPQYNNYYITLDPVIGGKGPSSK